MTYIPIPEKRRRALAAFIPDLAEARRRWEYGLDAPTEPQFWTDHILGIRERSPAFPTSAAERLWLTRHAHLAVTGADPIRVTFSAGIAGWPQDGADLSQLLRRADVRLRQAKLAGRNRVLARDP